MWREVLDLQNYSWNLWALPNFINGTWILLLGIFLFIRRRQTVVYGTYFGTAGWILGYGMAHIARDPQAGLFWSKVAHSSVFFIAPAMYQFTVEFYRLRDKRKYVLIAYCMSILFVILQNLGGYVISGVKFYPWGYYPVARFDAVLPLFLLFFFVTYASGLYNLYTAYRRIKIKASPLESQRAKSLLAAYVIACFGALDYFPFYGVRIYPGFHVFAGLGVVLIAYAIIRYRLMEIETVIHKTILWIATSVMVFIPIAALLVLLWPWLMSLPLPASSAIIVLSFFILLWYYRRLQPRIDHFFQRRRFDPNEVLFKVVSRVSGEEEVSYAINSLMQELKNYLYTRNLTAYIQDENTGGYKLAGKIGTMGR
jgi:hypothetical protein